MKDQKRTRLLSNYEISVFCRQTTMLLKAGIAPALGIDILMQDTEDPKGRALLERIQAPLREGASYHDAIEASGAFPEYMLNMISIGEQSGTLDTVMESLALYYEREDNIRSNIKSALSYPLIMIAMMFVVIVVLITKVLPIFSQVFSQLGTSMNAFSQSLLDLGTQINRYSTVFIAVLVLIIALFLYFTRTTQGKKQFANFAAKFGPTKHLYDGIAAGRFASGMALALSSGMDTFNGLDMTLKLVENRNIAAKIEKCRQLIIEGESFPDALGQADIFSKLYTRMVSVGFRSGSMDSVMKQIAERYQRDTDRRIYSIISILEPTLVIILSLIVGLILLSVILPLMGIMSSIG
ncbi:MAG: type II secretion system F family protein [Lachnospiraceae bacterium]|nr:type II secretion system F family protein [Lachnospiraceae bacterium]